MINSEPFSRHFPLPDPRNLSPEILAACLAEHEITLRGTRRILSALFRRSQFSPLDWTGEGGISQSKARKFPPLQRLQLTETLTSQVDQFTRVLFTTLDGLTLESVLIPLQHPERMSVCLSCQVGCAMECVACATGRMQTRRDLEGWEIIDQFMQLRELAREKGRKVTGVVFMGMGEPFLNYDRVIGAAKLLSYPAGGGIRAEAITISTVGLVQGIDRFMQENHKFRLAVSLWAASDAKRAILIPRASSTPVRDVIAAARRYALARRDRVMLVWICIGGFNCSEEDARELADLVGDTPVRLDLIDVNDASGRFHPPGPEELSFFRNALRHHLRQPVVRRYSGGSDIRAACGMLAGEHGEEGITHSA